MKRTNQMTKQGQPHITNMKEYFHAKWAYKRSMKYIPDSERKKIAQEIPAMKITYESAMKTRMFWIQRLCFAAAVWFKFLRSKFRKGN